MTPTLAIIGAGFSGTLTAVHLLRRGRRLRVVLINRSGQMARGVAYGTRTEAHVLNVPAGRMSAFPDDEESFLRFARKHDASLSGASFVPRRLYGEYLEALLAEAAANAPPGTALEQVVASVKDIQLSPDGASANLSLSDGRTLHADRVVLALGNYAPADPRIKDPRFYESPRYVRDPWHPEALAGVPATEPVLLIGTGLTMLDVTLNLRAKGVRGKIHALSRRGLLPQAHRASSAPPKHDHLPPGLLAGPRSTRAYLRAVRAYVELMKQQGTDWRDVIASLRPVTPALWEGLSTQERARFLRHVRPYWEVHRHRAAPELLAALSAELDSGMLTVHPGRLVALEEARGAVLATMQPRGSAKAVQFEVSTVINCTGPESDTRTMREPLISALRARGLLVPDPLGLGVETAPNLALLNAQGGASQALFYVGPYLKARYWEATAVPELRQHALKVADGLLASLPR